MEGLIVLGGIIVLIVWFFISKEFYGIAKEKGHPQEKYLWITFFLGVVGALLIIALPDRGNMTVDSNESNNTKNNEVSEIKKSSKLASFLPDATTYTQTLNEDIKELDFDNSSNIEKLEYYKKLFDSGRISENEFVEMRTMLIGQ